MMLNITQPSTLIKCCACLLFMCWTTFSLAMHEHTTHYHMNDYNGDLNEQEALDIALLASSEQSCTITNQTMARDYNLDSDSTSQSTRSEEQKHLIYGYCLDKEEANAIALSLVYAHEVALTHLQRSVLVNPLHPNVCTFPTDREILYKYGLIGIPESLSNLNNVHIRYFGTRQVKGQKNGCGMYALINSAAINEAMQSNSLTALTVLNNAEKHVADFDSEASESNPALLISLAKKLNLDNVYVLRLHNDKVSVLCDTKHYRQIKSPFLENFFGTKSSGEIKKSLFLSRLSHILTTECIDGDTALAEAVYNIRAKDNTIAHFICVTDAIKPNNHAILVTIIKQKESTPIIVFMDCNNIAIEDQSKSAAFVHFLYQACLA